MEKPNTDCPGVYRAQILNPIQVEKIVRYGVCDSSLLSNFRYLLLLAFAAVLPSDSESEDMPVLNFGQPQDGVIQTAFITNDIQRSMTQMTDLLHIGPWFLFESFELFDLRFRGQPADFQVTLALANSGHMQFELILPWMKSLRHTVRYNPTGAGVFIITVSLPSTLSRPVVHILAKATRRLCLRQ